MTPLIEDHAIVLFQGDSITDAGRNREVSTDLGWGYPALIAAWFSALYPEKKVAFLNRGNSGNRAGDLRARWKEDTLDLKPNWVSILIGINDTWRRYDSGEQTSVAQYEERYCRLLDAVASAGSRLVLIEPFVLPVDEGQKMWRDDLDPKIEVVRKLAAHYSAILVPADVELTRQSERLGAVLLAVDGVHPTELGHERLAELWLDTVAGTAADTGAVSRP